MDASETSKIYISISEHVISKTGSELVSNGKLKLSLLNEIHATWKMKMIQAGIISGTIETSGGSKPVTTAHDPLQTQDPTALPVYAESGIDIDAQFPSKELAKNEHGCYGESGTDTDALFPSKDLEMTVNNEHGFYGERGTDIDAMFPSTELEMFIKNEHEGLFIPQKDGSGDGDDADVKPNSNDPFDEDDEELNENDDDVEDDGGGIDDDDIPHLIVCQFDQVWKKKKTKETTKKWDCKFKAGVMHINGKDFFFSEAKGDFDF